MSMFVSEHFSMFVQTPCSPDLNSLDFYLWVHFKSIVYSVRNENEETLHQLISYVCQTFATTPAPKTGRDFPRSDACKRAMINVENTSSICCELRLHKREYINSYQIWNAYFNFVLSEESKILHD